MTNLKDWGGLWFLLLLAVATSKIQDYKESLSLLWILFISHLSCYVFVLMISPWDVTELMGMKANPLLLQASPIAIIIIGNYLKCRISSGTTKALQYGN